MRKSFFVLILALCSFSVFGQQEQEDHSASKWGMNFQAKIGYATLVSTDVVELQGTVNAGDMLVYYKFSKLGSISTGVGLVDFKTNGTTAGETYSLEQSHLRIPLYVNFSMSIFEDALSDKLEAYAGIGFYANTLLKEEIKTLTANQESSNQGWNGGYGFQLGMKFGISEDFNFGIGFETQSDFASMKKNNVERKLEGTSTINFQIMYNF